MVPLSALWLPIILSAVVVFIASSIMHMLLPYHKGDYQKIDEEKILPALRAAGLTRGHYVFPYCTPQEMKSPAMIEKYTQGPVGMITVFPSGPPALPKFLGMWFVYCLLISFFVAYLTGHTVAPGAYYLAVFRVVGTAAFLAYGFGDCEQRHLERPDLELHHQRSTRWLGVCATHRRNVRLALAALGLPQRGTGSHSGFPLCSSVPLW